MEILVSCERGLLKLGVVTVLHTVYRAVPQESMQTQTELQIFDRLRPVLRCVVIQSQSVGSGEGHELFFWEISEIVVLILRH